jgi:iron(III) transport system substrate-binding protein
MFTRLKTSTLAAALVASLYVAAPGSVTAQNLDELHKLALKEGGTINFYATLAQINSERILPVFEKRFPGMKVNHVDATADKLAARGIAEARGGRVFADVYQMALENVLQVIDQKLVVDWLPPEAAAYPGNLKGPNWLAADMVIITAAWNTNLVKKEDEPRQFDDFADPKWKGKLIGEPRDVELLIGLARHKYKND